MAGKKARSRKCGLKKSKSDSWKNIKVFRRCAWQIKEDFTGVCGQGVKVMALAGVLRTQTPAFVAGDHAPQVKF